MTRRLALVEEHAHEHSNCAFCPKLCRHSCPVSTVESRETTTPWGKMTSLHHVAEGNLDLGPAHAATWFACTGCMRCQSYCDHGNDVATTLLAGRAEATRSRVAPEAVYDVIARHASREARAAAAGAALFGASQSVTTGVVYVPGCTACVTRPDDARDGHRLAEALVDRPVRAATPGCCGVPLLDAGDREGFLAAAERFLGALGTPDLVVFADPGCLHALKVRAPKLGLRHALEMIHSSELAARHLDRLGEIHASGPVRYHDACKLGRGLGVYDAPRLALERTLGRAPDELYMRRELAECSGGGGQLPRIFPEASDAIADERMMAHEAAGGGLLVTACPGAAQRLSGRPGAGEVASLDSFLARSLRT
jgi:Fe-S oxidoreductase